MKKIQLFIILIVVAFCACTEKKDTLFTKITAEKSGITFDNKIVETDSFNILVNEYVFNGGGVAVGDFNNDHRPDLFFTGNQVSNKLYLNEGNFEFKDVSKAAKIEAKDRWNNGIAIVDINNDNLMDIYVCAAMSKTEKQNANMLFVNQGLDETGTPTFEEMAEDYGIADTGNSMGATFFDYDKDGLLDLYVLNNVEIHELPTNYRPKITDGTSLSNDKLYHNNGDGSFTDLTMTAGIKIEGFGLGIATADLNYDGWPDIYVSNDYLSNDVLYINNQDGTFTNQIATLVKHQSKFSMGSDISDLNNDGLLDIFTLDMLGETNQRLKTTIGHTSYNNYLLNDEFGYEYQYSRNMLQMGNGAGLPYSEIGLMAGISRTDWSWSPLFVDADNDGLRDLLITNGFPHDISDKDFADFNFNSRKFLSPSQILDSIPVVKIPNYAYKNTGRGGFEDIGEKWGLNLPSFSNGAVFADLDADGDMDYVTNNINEEAFVFENTLDQKKDQKHHFLLVDLKGPKTNSQGIGAKIVARLENGSFQYWDHHLNRGYMSSVQDIVQFGLGSFEQVKSLEVLWPDGKFQKLSKVKCDQTITLQYEDATLGHSDQIVFPLIQKQSEPMFKEMAEKIGVDYTHKEEDVVDYNVQRILPHKLTQNGPCLASGDLNGDGTEDFIVGSSSGYSPEIFLQTKNGTFKNSVLFSDDKSKKYEETALALFDLDNDGDLDLYLVSGSNEFAKDSEFYTDRLMINDGRGGFTMVTGQMPEIKASGSVVKAKDFDNDGFVDLFVGGRTPFGEYPLPDNSFLLKNVGGKLKDVTKKWAPDLQNVGMVTDGIWADIDQDGAEDLIVVGEFMPITIFKNEKSSFRKLKETGLDSLSGWWESIAANDFDHDGDIDFVAGNLGANNLYQPSKDRPITLLAKDFDNNGSMDPVMFAYFRNSFRDTVYKPFPVNFWGDLSAQSPMFRSKFNYYKDYAKATQNTLLTEDELKGAKKWVGDYDKTSYIENLGNGKFKCRPLPEEAQLAPINRIVVTDYNDDNNADLLLIGNDYGNEVFIGRYDAFNGALLEGDGQGGFKMVKPRESGFVVTGDAKDMISVKNARNKNPYFIVSENKGKIHLFQKNTDSINLGKM